MRGNCQNQLITVDEAGRLTGSSSNTTQGKLVMPLGVPGLCGSAKTAALNNLITEVLVPLSGDNSGSKPCDRGSAVTPQESPQTTTSRSLGPESNESKTSTSTSGEKRERESDNTSDIPVKRRLRLSDDTEEESVQDYDARCAELWIDGEMAACEAHELSQASSNGRRQHFPRDPRQVNDAVRRNNSQAQPVTQKTNSTHPGIIACFTELIKLYRHAEVLRRADFTSMINLLREVQRDFAGLSNEIHNIRRDQRKMLDALSLLSERMNVIQMYVLDTHKTIIGKR
ncbi:uncharacterized protein LOC125266260 isoform X2 [Megalobrama amblycephala]|uniref:uncharacterized protein LOC125266260 isoform X2 n=1 Tax=Megalobrama amblycephala TaxID=75352 RepID=UPI0020148283|nr:uncharacterized protein LOC125266260 isoform X2 [Megalobrama amblycephala]